ncbi:hypothetical protein GV054_06380 [Marinomonas mediterranea]|uniref:hypothetical protein n=1 Tax=Marinomonas mediterranea TaxID=119864 RepID=UPI00234A65A6|nr:hypothetical protein [Marinomonas mediterranea]WCN12665.1 hypothetical protein GV054_06380 [Marinomonas mediterranea]
MPRYRHFADFKRLVKHANSHFETHLRSGIHDLIEVLQDENCNLTRVQEALSQVNATRIRKYREALWFLQASYPGLKLRTLNIGEKGKAEAVKFSRMPLTAAYDPAAIPPVRHNPPSNALGKTVEEWLINYTGSVLIVAVHLSKYIQNMDDVFNERSVRDHMKSVLRIGNLTGAELACLHIKPKPLCDELEVEARHYGARRHNFLTPRYHMGTTHAGFRALCTGKDAVVVMGFDANICVNANLFGTNEPAAGGVGVATPLTAIADVVTSRSVLVTDGVICPAMGGREWGPLYLT